MRKQFVLVIVSNNKPERVAPFANKIGLPFHALAHKPLPGGFWEAGAENRMAAEECVVIGDQIFTDILGANLAGMNCILLEPIQPETKQKFIVFKRKIERPMLNSRRQKERRERDYGER
jgi:HAD superfamily phosphatase (TIGR01668 family)